MQKYFFMIYVTLYFRPVSEMFEKRDLSGYEFRFFFFSFSGSRRRSSDNVLRRSEKKKKKKKSLLSLQKKKKEMEEEEGGGSVRRGEGDAGKGPAGAADTLTVCHE